MFFSRKSIFFILVVTILTQLIGMANYTYIAPYLLSLDINRSTVQLLVTIFPLSLFLFPPIIGKFSDLVQSRIKFIILGAVGLTIVFFFLIFVKNFFFIVFFLFLYGFSSACLSLNFALYQELVENDQKYISYYNASFVLGWFFGAQLGGIVIDLFGIDSIFVFLVIISILNLIFVGFIREDRSKILERHENRVKIQMGEDEDKINLENDPQISKSVYVGLFFRNFGLRPILSVLAVIMSLHIVNNLEIGFLVGINPLIQFFLMLSISRLIKETNESYSIKIFMIIGYLLSAVVVLGYIISSDFLGFLTFQILVSLSYSSFWSATHIYIAKKTTPLNKGKYIGYANASFYLGSFLGGLIFSALVGFYNNYYPAMYYMIIFPILSAVVIFIAFKWK